MEIETVRQKANEKVQLFLDLNNRDNKLQQELGWGAYIVYRYLHTEEYFEEIVTFDDQEEAEAYLQSETRRIADESSSDAYPWEGEDLTDEDAESIKKHYQLKDWDLPIRRGACAQWGITFGLADAGEFIQAMPVDMALDLLVEFFYSALIPGYYEEH